MFVTVVLIQACVPMKSESTSLPDRGADAPRRTEKRLRKSSWEKEVARCRWNDTRSADLIINTLKESSIEYTIVPGHGIGFFVAREDQHKALDLLTSRLRGEPGIQLVEDAGAQAIENK